MAIGALQGAKSGIEARFGFQTGTGRNSFFGTARLDEFADIEVQKVALRNLKITAQTPWSRSAGTEPTGRSLALSEARFFPS